jgi:hypothetical protein
VCVSVDARREGARKDAIGEMVRKTQCVTITASGKTSVITADGKKLGDVMWINERLRMNSLEENPGRLGSPAGRGTQTWPESGLWPA